MKKSTHRKILMAILSLLVIPFASLQIAMAQNISVSGKVLDQKGVPVAGATVLVESTSNVTATDSDGLFTLKNVAGDATINVSFIGYKTLQVNVNNRSQLDLVLEEDAQSLEELVVVGYGVQRKSDVTGAIASVKGNELQSRSVESVQSALQGKAAGVMVYSASAAPGSSPSVRIRGLSSNTSSASDPLYVVDGLKVSDIAYLDPSMIESMEILKDGASAAIYGAEAGNGVVLITTKTGSKEQSRIFYDFSYGINKLTRKPDLMNAEQYVAYQRAAGNNTLMSNWDGVTNTDWSDVLYGEGGSLQRHTLGFESGNDKGSLYAALSYLDNDGMYYGNKDYLKRISFQVNASYKIKPWLEFSTNTSVESSNYSTASVQSVYLYDPLTPPFYDANNLPAYMQALINANGDNMFMKNENGDYAAVPQFASDSTNPMTSYYNQSNLTKGLNVRGVAALNFKPVKWLTFTSRMGYQLGASDYNYYGVPCYFSITPRTKQDYQAQDSIYKTYEWENFANFNHTFGKHTINAMAGMSFRHSWNNFTKGTTDTFTNDARNFRFLSFSSVGATDTVSGEEAETAGISYFGRVSYSYDDRYNVSAIYRADAYDSSKLSDESRWGHFPSISVGWTISNEHFMESISKDALSFLKLRASYGINGNVNVLGGYKYASSLGMTDYYPINGTLISTIAPSSVLANPSLVWEESRQIDAGIDVRFLNDRLSLTLDYFHKLTDGQLISMTAPLSSGTSTVVRNVGEVLNYGFEIDLGWKDQLGDFGYEIDANVSTLHNEVISLGGGSRIEGSDGFVYFDEGQPVWSFYGWDYLGPGTDGGAEYRDVDNNGIINDADKVYLGSAIPVCSAGLTLRASYKNFDFTIFGSGAFGNLLSLSTRNRPFANRPAVFWTDSYDVVGDGATYPHPDVNGDNHMYTSSMQLTNGSYFKIKQIQLGYTVPKNLTRKIAISNLRAFVSLENYFCFTNYQGMDPESVSASGSMGMETGGYPTPKTLTFGVNLSF